MRQTIQFECIPVLNLQGNLSAQNRLKSLINIFPDFP